MQVPLGGNHETGRAFQQELQRLPVFKVWRAVGARYAKLMGLMEPYELARAKL